MVGEPLDRDLPPGLRARYAVHTVIGEGRSKRVFRVHDSRLDRDVALALIKAPGIRGDALERTVREAQALGRLSAHPHIVTVHDGGEEDGQPYLVTEYMAGGDLAQLLEDAPEHRLPLRQALEVGTALAEGLAEAHANGVIHRDVKPQNVWLTADGVAKLGDFGLAYAEEQTRLTPDGAAVGTALYLAPELAMGQPADERSDIYSLGCVLYEMVTGQPPFVGDSFGAILGQHITSTPLSPSWHMRGCPPALESLILEMLAKPPRERPPSAVVVAERLRAIDADSAAAGEQAAGWSDERRSPYMGLRPYGPEDSALFFGRDEMVERLLARLAQHRLLGVIGPSGSGKSSLVLAGLLPALRDGALPGSDTWGRCVLTPGAQPLRELAARIAASLNGQGVALLRELEQDPRALDVVTRQAFAHEEPDARLAVVIDQFEEVFTRCRDAEQRRMFIEALDHATSVPDGRIVVILSMRADFYGALAGTGPFADALRVHHELLSPMEDEGLRAAIERPARLAGCRLEPGLIDLMLRDVAGEPGELPLLSHALLETWNRREGRTLTIAGYQASGGIRGAIAQTAEAVYRELTPAAQAVARNVFVRLTELGEGVEDTRRRVALAELAPEPGRTDEVRDVLETLTNARLLTMGEADVEVAHEALIREWPRLRGWLDEDREGLRLHRHLTESALAWEALGRDPGELYRGTRLAAALDADARGVLMLNPLEREFLEASRELLEAERKRAAMQLRRLRILLAGLAVFLAVAVGVGVVALIERGRANDEADRATAALADAEAARERADEQADRAQEAQLTAEAERETAETARQAVAQQLLETEALSALEEDRSLGLLLAIEAHRRDPSASSADVLRAALTDDVRFLGNFAVQPEGGAYVSVAVSPLGDLIATEDALGIVRLFDADDYTLLHDWTTPSPPLVAAGLTFSRDGTLLASGGRAVGEPNLFVWRTSDYEEILRAALPNASAPTSFSPDSTLLFDNGNIVEIATGQIVHSFRPSGPNEAAPAEQDDLGFAVGGYSPDAAIVTSARLTQDEIGAVGVYDASTYQELGTIRGNTEALAHLTFSADGTMMVTAGADGQVVIWDTATLAEIERIDLTQVLSAPLVLSPTASFSPDNRWIALATLAAEAVVWDIELSAPVGTPLQTKNAGETGLSIFAPDGRLFVASNDAISIWRPDGVGLIARSVGVPRLGQAVLSADGSRILTTGNGDHALLRVLDTATGSEVRPPIDTSRLSASPVLATSADGSIAVTQASDCFHVLDLVCEIHISIWSVNDANAALGRIVLVPEPTAVEGGSWVLPIALSPDGALMAVMHRDGRIVLYDTATQEQIGPDLLEVVAPADFDPIGTLSFGAVTPAIAMAEVDGELWLAAIHARSGQTASWAIDGGEVALISTGDLGQSDLGIADAFVGVVGLSSEAVVALGRNDGSIALFDGHTFDPIGEIPGAGAAALQLAFSADGNHLAVGTGSFPTGSNDGPATVWDLGDGPRLKASFGSGSSVSMSADGDLLLVSESSGRATLWDVETETWTDLACSATGRNLTRREWERYFPGEPYAATCAQWPGAQGAGAD